MRVRTVCILLAALIVAIANAGANFIPHPGYPAPNYFSGTNSRAFYRVQVTAPHNHIAVVELYLNG
jgi:hypothetical protein